MTRISKRENRRLVDLFETLVERELRPAAAAATPTAELVWYVLATSPLCERAVASRLRRAVPGVASWVPTVRRRVKMGPRRETIDHVLFPRYLFVGFERDPPWLHVREVMGVQGVLGVAGVPAAIDATIVGTLMWKCESGQLAPPEPPTPQRGMQVVAERGIYRGFEGRVTKVRKQTGTIDVLFDMFSSLPTTLRLDDVVSVAYACRRTIG